jgi:hypothetical protein
MASPLVAAASTNDGYTYAGSSTNNWPTAYNGTSTPDRLVNLTPNYVTFCTLQSGNWMFVHRSDIPFDTSSVGIGSTVTGVSLYLRCTGGIGTTGSRFSLVTSCTSGGNAMPNQTSTYAASSWGSTAAGGASSATANSDMNLSIDTGVIPVVKNGYTHIGIRESVCDIPNHAVATGENYTANFASQDHATTGYRPKLTVEYTEAASGKPYYYHANQ